MAASPRMLRRVAAIAVAWAAVEAAASQGERAANPTALAADDACSSGDEACALNALQTRSSLGSEPAHKDEPSPLPGWRAMGINSEGELQMRRSLPEYSGIWALNATVLNEQWGWPTELQNSSFEQTLSKSTDSQWAGNGNCANWNAFFWPRLSFWGKEFMKREKTVTLGDKVAEEKLWNWTHRAMYLTCVNDFDMRAGHPWAEKVNEYMTGIFNNGGSFDMPELDEFFYNRSVQMITATECVWWATGLICDISYWISKYQGNKVLADGDYCWDKVEHPGYNFLIRGFSDNLDFPEYLQCQEHGVGDEYFGAMCNMGGHYENISLNESWGTGVPEAARADVLQCQAKMGGPQTINAFKMNYAWEPSIGLMDCPDSYLGCYQRPKQA